MGLEEVKQDILDASKSEVDALMQKAREDASKIIDDAKKLEKSLDLASKEELAALKKSMEIKHVASAQLEAKRALLDLKKELIEEAFQIATKEISAIPKKEKQKLYQEMLKKVESEMDIGTIVCNEKDADLFEHKNIKHKEMLGRFVAIDRSGKVEADCQFETMLSLVREHYLGEMATMLFKTK